MFGSGLLLVFLRGRRGRSGITRPLGHVGDAGMRTLEVADRREVFPIMVSRHLGCVQHPMLGLKDGSPEYTHAT